MNKEYKHEQIEPQNAQEMPVHSVRVEAYRILAVKLSFYRSHGVNHQVDKTQYQV